MPDRLQEIRARLDAATPGPWVRNYDNGEVVVMDPDDGRTMIGNVTFTRNIDLIAHAPADIAWLLAALESERRHSAMLAQRIDGHLLENVRLLAEVERLHGASVSERSQSTNLSVGKPFRTKNGTELLPDDSVVQGVTND